MPIQIDTLIRSNRRTVALILERDGSLTVRAPKRAAMRDIQNFVHEKADWIERSREKLKAIVTVPKKEFADGETFPFLGRDYELRLIPHQRQTLHFDSGFTLKASARPRGEAVFTQWYRSQALTIFTERVTYYATLHGFSPKQVKVNSAKTRWGSCSTNGTINFTWRLVMAPIDVIDYVVIHELVHLRVKDHSQRFWQAVERLCPKYKAHRIWLRDHGEKLTL